LITVVALWEHTWLAPDVESFIYRQVCEAYGVDRIIFAPERDDLTRLRVEQFATVEAALATTTGQRVFLEPEGSKTLSDIPEGDIVLITGNTGNSNAHLANEGECYRFKMLNEDHKGIFGVSAVAIALAHRFGQ
jgi:hypothetical protein